MSALRSGLALLVLGAGFGRIAAQELPFQREYPGSSALVCAERAPPSVSGVEARAQAGQLGSAASQAVLLGDLDRALAMLDRAVELDPASADLAYRRGRVLEDLDERERAREEYCRSLALLGTGSTADDARARLEQLARAESRRVPMEAVAAFVTGLESADQGAFREALASFEEADGQAVDWPAAVYNRAAALDRLNRPGESAQAFSRYLDLRPDAPDAIAVSRRIGQLQSLALTQGPSPGTALALGVLVPGLGHFYAGRSGGGITLLALAAGSVAAGFLVKEVDVRCLTPTDGTCPPGQVVSRTTSRPYLTASLAAAAAIGVAGAVEAFVNARSRRRGVPFARSGSADGWVTLPGLDVQAGRIGVALVRLRFR